MIQSSLGDTIARIDAAIDRLKTIAEQDPIEPRLEELSRELAEMAEKAAHSKQLTSCPTLFPGHVVDAWKTCRISTLVGEEWKPMVTLEIDGVELRFTLPAARDLGKALVNASGEKLVGAEAWAESDEVLLRVLDQTVSMDEGEACELVHVLVGALGEVARKRSGTTTCRRT